MGKIEEGLVGAFPGGFFLIELGRRYADGACMNRIALVSELGVAMEGSPDCGLPARCPGDMYFISPLSCPLVAISPL